MATEILRRIDPLVVILDGCRPFGRVAVAQAPLAIDHDQDVGDPKIAGPFLHLLKVLCVLGFVLEKLIDVFDAIDAESLFGNFRKI